MKIKIIVIFLLLISNVANAKVYKIKLESDDWIKVIPHVYPAADWTGQEWYCGAQSYVTTMWRDNYGTKKKLFMKAKLSKDNKEKHLKTFDKFLRNYINPPSNSGYCPRGKNTDLETWVDYENKIIGIFKVINYDEWGCMIFQSLIQIKRNIKTSVAMVCQKSHGTFYDFLTVPRYFKIDLDSFRSLNN